MRSDPEVQRRFDEHLWLAERMARSFWVRKRGILSKQEFLSLAQLGLWDAAKKWTPLNPDSNFELYAKSRIRGSMLDGIRSSSWFTRRVYQDAVDGKVALPEFCRFRDSRFIRQDTADVGDVIDRRREIGHMLEAMGQLSVRDRDVLERFFLKGEMLQVIARELAVSEPRICQLRDRALERLRERMKRR